MSTHLDGEVERPEAAYRHPVSGSLGARRVYAPLPPRRAPFMEPLRGGRRRNADATPGPMGRLLASLQQCSFWDAIDVNVLMKCSLEELRSDTPPNIFRGDTTILLAAAYMAEVKRIAGDLSCLSI